MGKKKTCERLVELMKYYNLSQADVCRRTGLTKSMVSLYVSGKRTPKQDNLYAISNAFNISPVWLMGLDVPMKIDNSIESKYSKESAQALINVKNDPDTRELVDVYAQLSDADKRVVRMLAYSLAQNHCNNP